MAIGSLILAFGLGALWMTLTAVQSRLIARDCAEYVLAGWACFTSLIWGYLVRTVALQPYVIVPYALGTAIGIVVGRRIGKRLER